MGPAAEVLGAAFWGETRKQTGGEKQAQGDPRTLPNPGRSHAEVSLQAGLPKMSPISPSWCITGFKHKHISEKK